MKRQLVTALMTAILLCGSTGYAKTQKNTNMKTGDMLLFDFGANAEDGWEQVDASTKYSKERGFGFSMVSFAENEELSGGGVLSDAVKLKKHMQDEISFDVDLPPGMYEISVYSGNISYMNICFEEHPAIINMQNAATEARVEIPVTDGQLNMSLAQGLTGTDLSVSAMTIKKTGELTDRRTRIFVCGDSTAATFYPLFLSQPLEDGYRGGWGQMLQTYVNDSFYVHNLASPGLNAKEFLASGILDSVLYFMQPGDYVLIDYGINDSGAYSAEEYEEAMVQIIEAVRKQDGVPILVSGSPCLDDFSADGSYNGADRCYAAKLREIAEKQGIKLIDLHSLAVKYYERIGYDSTYSMYWKTWSGTKDTIHLSRNGAGQLARLIAENCADLGIGNLRGYGISGDIRLRCSTLKNSVYLENTTPQALPLSLVTVNYVSGKVSRTETTPITLPAYDVLAPNQITELYAPLYDAGSRSYIIGSGICIPLEWVNREKQE